MKQMEDVIVQRVVSIVMPIMKMIQAQSQPKMIEPKVTPENTQKEKSVKELSSYVRYVFAEASSAERSMAEDVIKRFTRKHERDTKIQKSDQGTQEKSH